MLSLFSGRRLETVGPSIPGGGNMRGRGTTMNNGPKGKADYAWPTATCPKPRFDNRIEINVSGEDARWCGVPASECSLIVRQGTNRAGYLGVLPSQEVGWGNPTATAHPMGRDLFLTIRSGGVAGSVNVTQNKRTKEPLPSPPAFSQPTGGSGKGGSCLLRVLTEPHARPGVVAPGSRPPEGLRTSIREEMTMHTEEQARNLWCPMAKEALCETDHYKEPRGPVANRWNKGKSRCIASDCAMWQEIEVEICQKCKGQRFGAGSGSWTADCEHAWERLGYCGLARGRE